MCPSFVWWIGLPCKDAGSRVPEELVGCMQVGVDITIFKKERGYPIPSSLNSWLWQNSLSAVGPFRISAELFNYTSRYLTRNVRTYVSSCFNFIQSGAYPKLEGIDVSWCQVKGKRLFIMSNMNDTVNTYTFPVINLSKSLMLYFSCLFCWAE